MEEVVSQFIALEFTMKSLGVRSEKVSPTISSFFENVQSIAASASHSMVVKNEENGATSLWTFGLNDYGQLGVSIPETEDELSIRLPDTRDQCTQSSSNLDASSAQPLPSDAKNESRPEGGSENQKGDPEKGVDYRLTPVLVTSLSKHKIIRISCGSTHAAVVTDQGKLFTWGQGIYGQLGLGAVLQRYTPYEVTTLGSEVFINDVQAGSFHTAIITSAHSLYTCGAGTHGELGHGDFKNLYYFTMVSYLKKLKIVQVSCGRYHTAAVTSGGSVYTFGAGEHYQLGHGNDLSLSTPKCIDIFKRIKAKIKQVSCGAYHTVSVSVCGQLFVWGTGKEGELGLGTQNKVATVPTLNDIHHDMSVSKAYASDGCTMVISDVGKIWAMGANAYNIFDQPTDQRAD
ncbi:uncharacterized protein LOC126322375 [Schistocerca gregaria]|uniref:uncharacterized protein LOC126322375 n=1 Tax=Schistocerca gregaria TaxID=7010 RepID=UPI00211F039E|nr:uncharacterized protein LOC126322375 [Schistocerca gregaria]